MNKRKNAAANYRDSWKKMNEKYGKNDSETNSRFNIEGGWCDSFGSITEKVQNNFSNNYTLELKNKKITLYINDGFLYWSSTYMDTASAECHFLGLMTTSDRYMGVISMIKINTGWFSSIQVSHDALVCLDDLNIPLNSKSDWKEAIKKKEDVMKHYEFLKQQDVNNEKEREKKEKQKSKRIREEAKKAREEAKTFKEREKEKMKNERKKRLLEKYGEDDGFKIYKKKIWVGMTKKMLIDSRGKPRDVDETVYKNTVKQYCFYKQYTTRQDNIRYKFRVDLEDNIVVGWKDLD